MIVTHTNPDFDAICGVWLLKRFGGFENDRVAYVNTGNPDAALLAEAVAVVDTGKEYDTRRLRFDHHHLPSHESNDTCATLQVYNFLTDATGSFNPRPEMDCLLPLIRLIFTGDTGRNEANFSRELGIHALLSGFKASFAERKERATDEAIMEYGFSLLDTIELRLRNQAKARAELAEKVVYKSLDGLLWAIKYGSAGSSFAAMDEGARIVVFEGEPLEVEGGVTYPVGLMRAGEWNEPHCGELIKAVRQWNTNGLNSSELDAELNRFFCHSAGFFSGRGTAKAPVFEPVTIDLAELARLIDRVWLR